MKFTKSQILNFLHNDEMRGMESYESQTLLLAFKEGDSVVPSACYTLFIMQQGNRYVARLVYTKTKNWYLECGDENSDVLLPQNKQSNFILNELQSPQSACSIQRRYNKSFNERKQSAANIKGGLFCSHIKLLLSIITSQTLDSLEMMFEEASKPKNQAEYEAEIEAEIEAEVAMETEVENEAENEAEAKSEDTPQSLVSKDEAKTPVLIAKPEENKEPIKEIRLEPRSKTQECDILTQSYAILTPLSMLLHKVSFKGQSIQITNRLETLECVMHTYTQERDVHIVKLEDFDLEIEWKKYSRLFESLCLALTKRVLLYLDLSHSLSNLASLHTSLKSFNGVYHFVFDENTQISIPIENLQIILNIRAEHKVRDLLHYDDTLESEPPMKVLESICDTKKIPQKEKISLEKFLSNMLYLYAIKKLSLKIDPIDIKRRVLDYIETPEEIFRLLKIQKTYWIEEQNAFELELVDTVIEAAFFSEISQTQRYFYI